MIRPQRLLHLFILLLAMHIPAGASSAGEWTRGAYTCTGDVEGGAVPDYEETTDHVLHAFCLAIQGRAGEGIPALHNLADHHAPSRLDARFFIAEYRATDGRFGSIASPDLTVKQIDEAIRYYFGALAIMKTFAFYPEPDYAGLERLFQMELKSSYRVPRLHLHRFRMGFLSNHNSLLLDSPGYDGPRDLYTTFVRDGETRSGDGTNETLASLRAMKEHASGCARLPGKAHFNSALQDAVRQGCELMSALADDLYELEHRRYFDILGRPGCQELNESTCPEYFTVHNAIEDAIAAWSAQEQRIFASAAGLKSSFRVKSRAELVEERRMIQSCLSSLGHDAGPADGIFGPRARQAISSWKTLSGYSGGDRLNPGEVAALLDACGSAAVGPATAEDGAGAGPVCTGGTGPPCWQEVANLPGCRIWNSYPKEEETVTWSGGCADGRAAGMGKETWRWKEDGQSKTDMYEGPYVDGKANGHWVERFASGNVLEGPYVDGKRHGHWVLRYADGGVDEGPYADGERNGHWVLRWPAGAVEEGPFVDGEKHGHWVERFADGLVQEGPFVDGEKHGHWVLRSAAGQVQEGPYVDGEKHGHWVLRWPDGHVEEGPYVDGERNGHWVVRYADGGVYEGPYVDGKKHGQWVERRADGTLWFEGRWENGTLR